MGTSNSKPDVQESNIDRVEFHSASNNRDIKDAQVKILTNCVLKKPAGYINYEIVHNFEDERGQDPLRKRNVCKPSQQEFISEKTENDVIKGSLRNYVVCHAENENRADGGGGFKDIGEVTNVFRTDDHYERDNSRTGNATVEDTTFSYNSSYELLASSEIEHEPLKHSDHPLSCHYCLSVIPGQLTDKELHQREILAKSSLRNCFVSSKCQAPKNSDSGVSACHKCAFAVANNVVEKSLHDGLNEVNASCSTQTSDDSCRKRCFDSTCVTKHAKQLSQHLVTSAICDSVNLLRDEKPEGKISCTDSVKGFSSYLSTGIIGKAIASAGSNSSRVRIVRRHGSSSKVCNNVDRCRGGLAKPLQRGVSSSLKSRSQVKRDEKWTPPTEGLAEYGKRLTDDVLDDVYYSIRVGQYARRMSENIAISAYDSATFILTVVKEQDHYFQDLADKVVHSALDEIMTVDGGIDLVSNVKTVNNNEVMKSPKISDGGAFAPSSLDPGLLGYEEITMNGFHDETSDTEISDEGDTSNIDDSSEDDDSDCNSRPPKITRVIKSDRPLSGYAEKLAELLAEEDEDLDFLDSDEELETTLDKIEERFGSKRKISMEISRIRSLSSTDDSCVSDDQSTGRYKPKIKRSSSKEPRLSRIPQMPDSGKEYGDHIDDVLKGTKPQHSVFSSKAYYKTAAVIDAGCGILKAGMAGQLKPQSTFSSVIGTPKRFSQDLSNIRKAFFVGDSAIEKVSMLHIDYPFQPCINNWNEIHNILEYTLEQELDVCDSEHPVFLAELALKDRKQREKLTEIMFERFGVPAYYLASQGPLTLYSVGLLSGVCLNSGFSVTQSESVFEGYTLPHATTQLMVGGDTIATYLGRLLQSARGLSFNSSSERRILNLIKESTGYITNDINAEEKRFSKSADSFQVFTLPDGHEIELGVERCECTEILFDPSILGINQHPLPRLLLDAITGADVEIKDLLSRNVVVSGGTSLLKGFIPRLEKETKKNSQLVFKQPPDPKIAPWIGGSVLASLSVFGSQWITLEEYAERGTHVIHSKCF